MEKVTRKEYQKILPEHIRTRTIMYYWMREDNQFMDMVVDEDWFVKYTYSDKDGVMVIECVPDFL